MPLSLVEPPGDTAGTILQGFRPEIEYYLARTEFADLPRDELTAAADLFTTIAAKLEVLRDSGEHTARGPVPSDNATGLLDQLSAFRVDSEGGADA